MSQGMIEYWHTLVQHHISYARIPRDAVGVEYPYQGLVLSLSGYDVTDRSSKVSVSSAGYKLLDARGVLGENVVAYCPTRDIHWKYLDLTNLGSLGRSQRVRSYDSALGNIILYYSAAIWANRFSNGDVKNIDTFFDQV